MTPGDWAQHLDYLKGELKVAAYHRVHHRYELQFIHGLTDAELDAIEADGAAIALKEIAATTCGKQLQ